jgi:hypothetical protein
MSYPLPGWNATEREPGMTKTWRARLLGALATLAMTAGLLTATSAPASAAAMACNYDGHSFNACLTIDYAGPNRWNVTIGFDRYLPKQYADEILACPGGGIVFAVLWGNDGGHPKDQQRESVPLTAGNPHSGTNPDGLFAGFAINGVSLDEDPGNAQDEIYAEVTYFDCHNGLWMTYATGEHRGIF